MRILLWHGYLLGGTGSNVYSRQLAREWSRAGHDVTVLSQETRPEAYDLGGASTVRPDVGGFLPVTSFALVAMSGNIYTGLWYAVVFTAISVVVSLLFVKETHGRRLEEI